MIAPLLLSVIFLTKLVGSAAVVHFKDKLHILLGFSAGAMITVALLDIVPESIELSGQTYGVGFVMLFVVLGFFAYMIIDRLFSLHNHQECEQPTHKGVLNIMAIVLHSLLDGASIGLAFNISNILGLSVMLAVLAHSLSDGVNAAGIALGSGSRKVFGWSIINAFAPIIGFYASFAVKIPQSVLGLILAIIAGLFLYISTNDLLPEAHHKHSSIWTTTATIFGVVSTLYIVNLVS
ncbi:ZIP family metal transporter [Candidatus Saccharibacteria bacterium]|nr:ZIP family metal transporter [Candidatus Saccharibacteria bacterium]